MDGEGGGVMAVIKRWIDGYLGWRRRGGGMEEGGHSPTRSDVMLDWRNV